MMIRLPDHDHTFLREKYRLHEQIKAEKASKLRERNNASDELASAKRTHEGMKSTRHNLRTKAATVASNMRSKIAWLVSGGGGNVKNGRSQLQGIRQEHSTLIGRGKTLQQEIEDIKRQIGDIEAQEIPSQKEADELQASATLPHLLIPRDYEKYMLIVDDKTENLEGAKKVFPNATCIGSPDEVCHIINEAYENGESFRLIITDMDMNDNSEEGLKVVCAAREKRIPIGTISKGYGHGPQMNIRLLSDISGWKSEEPFQIHNLDYFSRWKCYEEWNLYPHQKSDSEPWELLKSRIDILVSIGEQAQQTGTEDVDVMRSFVDGLEAQKDVWEKEEAWHFAQAAQQANAQKEDDDEIRYNDGYEYDDREMVPFHNVPDRDVLRVIRYNLSKDDCHRPDSASPDRIREPDDIYYDLLGFNIVKAGKESAEFCQKTLDTVLLLSLLFRQNTWKRMSENYGLFSTLNSCLSAWKQEHGKHQYLSFRKYWFDTIDWLRGYGSYGAERDLDTDQQLHIRQEIWAELTGGATWPESASDPAANTKDIIEELLDMAPGPDYIEVADVRGLRSQLADLRGHERDKEDEEGERTTGEYAEFIRHAHNIFLQPLSSKESAQLKTFEDKDSLGLPDETSDKDRWLTHVGKRNHDTDQSMLPRNDTIIDSEFLLQVGRYQLLSQRGSLAVRDHLNHENTLTVLHSTHDESDDTGFTPISAQIDTDGMLLLHVEDAEIIDKKRRVREYHFSVNFDSDTGQLTKTTS